MTVRVRPLAAADAGWTAAVMREQWGGTVVVGRGRFHHTDLFPGLLAARGGRTVGLLIALHAGAIGAARRVKPTIPRAGDHGIPIRDKIELERRLDPER